MGRKQRSKTFGTAKAASKFANLVDAVGVEKALALLAESAPAPSLSLDETYERFVTWKTDRGDISARVRANYDSLWRNHARGPLGHRELDAVTEADVQEWVDGLAKRLAPKTVHDAHVLLHSVYRWAGAATRGLTQHDPCAETVLPKRTKRQVHGLSLVEYQRLTTAARRLDPDTADFVAFMGCTGWRFSEAAALPVWAVEDDGTNVYVNMVQVFRRMETGWQLVPDAKSQAGLRRIRLIGESVPIVRERIADAAPDALVFTNANGTRWHYSAFVERHWRPAVEAAKLAARKPTPHWLRHTHVYMCHAAGMSLAEIQRRIGHEDIRTTINVYGRQIDSMPDDVAARLDVLLGASAPIVAGSVVAPDGPVADGLPE